MRSPSIRGRGHLAGALGGELLLGVEVLEAPDGLPEGVVLGHTPRAGALQGTPSGGGGAGWGLQLADQHMNPSLYDIVWRNWLFLCLSVCLCH